MRAARGLRGSLRWLALAAGLGTAAALACNLPAGSLASTATFAPPGATLAPSATQPPQAVAVTAAPTEPPPSATPSAAVSATPENTPPPEATPLPEGACQEPPDDYSQVTVNGETLSRRTYWMLEQATRLYAGPADLLRVTQGSFRSDVGTSFGTHAGGGAVDISIRDPASNAFLFDEADGMARALRLAGFAAWYRAPNALGEGSAPHIHAIAVGDRDLSPAAQAQLTGAEGYFNGMDGLTPPYGPNPDPGGGPIVCPWMTP